MRINLYNAQARIQSYRVPREMNVGFSPHYVKYACLLPHLIEGSEGQSRHCDIAIVEN